MTGLSAIFLDDMNFLDHRRPARHHPGAPERTDAGFGGRRPSRDALAAVPLRMTVAADPGAKLAAEPPNKPAEASHCAGFAAGHARSVERTAARAGGPTA